MAFQYVQILQLLLLVASDQSCLLDSHRRTRHHRRRGQLLLHSSRPSLANQVALGGRTSSRDLEVQCRRFWRCGRGDGRLEVAGGEDGFQGLEGPSARLAADVHRMLAVFVRLDGRANKISLPDRLPSPSQHVLHARDRQIIGASFFTHRTLR